MALNGLPRFIGTTRTAKFRVFQFLPSNLTAESKIVVIATDAAWVLGVLSSRIHVVFATRIGGWLGVGNDPTYNHTDCFNKFPFPVLDPTASANVARIAEELDSHRKGRLAEHSHLTITDLYNALEKLRSGDPLSDAERAIHSAGLITVLKQLHEELDTAVFNAYGWPTSLEDEEILERLVALNAERGLAELEGDVRWLRPEFQNPGGPASATQTALDIGEPEEAEAEAQPRAKTAWPRTLAEQAHAVRAALTSQRGPITPEQLARTFLRARSERVHELLDTLASLGQARELPDGRFAPPPTATHTI